MHVDNVTFGAFLVFFAMTLGSAWFWTQLRYALFGEPATGTWAMTDGWGVPLLWLRIFGIPFMLAVFGELWVPIAGTVAGFHPLTVFIAALIGVVIDWILYGIGVGLHHPMPASETTYRPAGERPIRAA
jgi:hypothetical protein